MAEDISYDELKLAYIELEERYNNEFDLKNEYRQKYQQQLDEYDEVLADLEAAQDQRDTLKKELNSVNNAFHSLQVQFNELENSYEELSSLYEERERQHAEELAVLKRPLTPWQEEALNQAAKPFAYTEEEYEKIRQYNLELAEKLATEKDINRELSAKVDGMESEYKRLVERDRLFRKLLREVL